MWKQVINFKVLYEWEMITEQVELMPGYHIIITILQNTFPIHWSRKQEENINGLEKSIILPLLYFIRNNKKKFKM